MRSRFTLSIAAALLVAAPVLAEPPKPAVVLQAKPLARLLNEYREMIRQSAGPIEGERKVKEFEREVKEVLGEQGFEGFDINRPLAAYVVLSEKIEDASIVLVVPVVGEKDFLGFLERLKVTVEPVKDKKSIYRLGGVAEEILPKDSFIQFTPGGWAYMVLNVGEPLDPKNLIAPGDLINNADQSLYSATVFPGRVPEKLLTHLLNQMDNTVNAFKGFAAAGAPKHVGKMLATILDEGPKLIRRYGETGLKEADEVSLRFTWDQTTGDTVTELTLVPKAGTPLAKDIAAIAATKNRFAGLIPKDAAGGLLFNAPLFAKEIREIVAAMLEAGQEELKMGDLPEAFHPVVDEIAKSLIRSVKKGDLDAAIALLPSKDGKFTVVGGVSCDEPAEADKALRKAGQVAALIKLFEFDVAKVGDVSIHKVPFHRGIPADAVESIEKVFGKDSPGYVAFAKDAVFVAYGPDALTAIKAAIAAKPGPAPAVDLNGNMKHLHKLIGVLGGEKVAEMFAQHVGTDDKAVNMLRVTVDGGKTLTVKLVMNLRYLPRAVIIGEAVDGDIKPPPAK